MFSQTNERLPEFIFQMAKRNIYREFEKDTYKHILHLDVHGIFEECHQRTHDDQKNQPINNHTENKYVLIWPYYDQILGFLTQSPLNNLNSTFSL